MLGLSGIGSQGQSLGWGGGGGGQMGSEDSYACKGACSLG